MEENVSNEEIGRRYDIHPNTISRWRREFSEFEKNAFPGYGNKKLTARPKKKYEVTIDSEHDFQVPDNLLNREFKVDTLNSVWVSDITCIRVANYWMYLTVIIDLADRMVVGWSLSRDMTAENTVIAAFKMAAINRGITKSHQLLFHSDRGVQNACYDFVNLLKTYNCSQSMSRKGNCWDNAVAESFFKTIKIECLNKYIFGNQEMLKKILIRYIEGWYNSVKIHSALDNKSPLMTFKLKSLCLTVYRYLIYVSALEGKSKVKFLRNYQ